MGIAQRQIDQLGMNSNAQDRAAYRKMNLSRSAIAFSSNIHSVEQMKQGLKDRGYNRMNVRGNMPGEVRRYKASQQQPARQYEEDDEDDLLEFDSSEEDLMDE